VPFIYLTDVREYGGATAVLPGSHRQLFCHWMTEGSGPGGETDIPDLPYSKPVAIKGRAGDVIWMHYLLAHGSSENHDAHVRVALNGTIRPDPQHPYQPRNGPPADDWTPIDRTLMLEDDGKPR
jgi:ectoine hydroxylase-related dioxygenase (phytanoyl-CoA dioxygenase family)